MGRKIAEGTPGPRRMHAGHRRFFRRDVMAEYYRADHVGSLLRPPAVLEARAAHAARRCSLAQLRDLEDKAILEVLEMQRQAGIDVLTDGEYRRSWWSGAIPESVEGVIDDPD